MPASVVAARPGAEPPSKTIFVGLEGLRGIAALLVLCFHVSYIGRNFLPSAYIAVDIFFLISGFVISLRYDNEISTKITISQFMVARILRLYPLYFLGTVITFFVILLGYMFGSSTYHPYTPLFVNLLFGMAGAPSSSGSALLYPLNPPAWSLAFELLANLIFAFMAPMRKSRFWLLASVGAAALACCALSKNFVNFGADWLNWHLGLPRITFAFFLGVIIQRVHAEGRLPRLRCPPVLLGIALVALCCIPVSTPHYGLLMFIIIVLICPSIVIAAIGQNVEGREKSLFLMLGILSYPVYALQTGIYAVCPQLTKHLHLPDVAAHLLAIPVILVTAWLATKFFDAPLRRWLNEAIHRRPRAAPLSTELAGTPAEQL